MKEIKELRRLAYVKASVSIFIRFMRGDMMNDEVVNPLPPDTRFVRSGHDGLGTLYLIVESKEFAEVDEDGNIPEFGPIRFKRGEKPSSNKEVH